MTTSLYFHSKLSGSVAQSVEQRTENPCVDSSILSRATTLLFVEKSKQIKKT